MLYIAVFMTLLWSDGMATRLYTEPCENPDLSAWLTERFQLPTRKALNIIGTTGIEACYVMVENDFAIVLDVDDRISANLYLED